MVGRPTPEQRDFRTALRAFAHRECGTRAQRDALTAETGGPHNPSRPPAATRNPTGSSPARRPWRS